jgi:AcrR family transcriptional regulator
MTTPGAASAALADASLQRSAQVARRREELLDAADRVVRRDGVKTSVALIAKEAGVTKPIIYRYFADLDELHQALAARYKAKLNRWMVQAREIHADLDRRGRYSAVIDAYFEAVERQPNLFRFLLRAGGNAGDQSSGLSWFTQYWARDLARYYVLESGAPQDAARTTAMSFGMVGALEAGAGWWLEEGLKTGSVPRSVVVEAITDLLISGLPNPVADVPPTQWPGYLPQPPMQSRGQDGEAAAIVVNAGA